MGLVWSGSAAWTVVHQLGLEPTGLLGLFLLVTSITLVLAQPARWLFSRSWQKLQGGRRARWLMACVVMGGLLALAIPIEDTPLRSVEETVEVIATGEKNPASVGTEVWVLEATEDGRPVPFANLDLTRSWELREGALLSAGQSMPAPISWDAEVSQETVLVLVAHPYSGIAEVTRGGTTQRIDLYDASGVVRVIELPRSSWPRLYHLSVALASSLFFGLILFAAGVWLILRPPHGTPESEQESEPSADPVDGRFGKWEWLALATPPAVVWTVYLLTFWPGVMSHDSINQWDQILSGNFTNWHPAFHTLTEWALTRVRESPATVAAAQVAVLSGVVGWALASMRRLGLSTSSAWLISGAVAIWPANGITVITLWKDIPYAISVLALGVIILREVDGRTRLIDKRPGWVLVVGVTALVSLYHHAGLMVAIGSMAILWVAMRQRAIIGAALLALIVVVMVQSGLYQAVGISGTEHPGITGVATHHIAAHLASGTELTPQEQSEVAELIPIPGSSWYDCEQINSMIFDPNFSIDSMHDQAARARSVWWSLFTRDPAVDLGQLACKSHVVWHIRQVPGGHRYVTQLGQSGDGEVFTILANDLGLELNPIVDPLTGPLADVIVNTQRPFISWLFWRGPLFLYVLLLGAAVAALRARDWRYWVVVVPSVLVAGTLVIAAPAQDYRYMWPVVLTGMTLGPYLLFAVSRRETADPDQALPSGDSIAQPYGNQPDGGKGAMRPG